MTVNLLPLRLFFPSAIRRRGAPARGLAWPRLASLSLAAVAVFALAALVRPAAAQAIHVQDTSALHPPSGARVAIVEFGDLECPACAHANPLLMQAAASYKIPWVRHDLLIPGHIWSPTAAVYARWFDEKNARLGEDYRNQVFANQNSIETQVDLNRFTQRYASAHGVGLPFAIDPQGKLAAAVQADTDLGRRMGITQTPTVFIVAANAKGAPYIQVLDVDRDLYRDIDQAMAEVRR